MALQSFFRHDELVTSKKLPKRLPGCGSCGLYKTCKSPKMEATGEGEKGILFIAEAPGEEEDRAATQLVGTIGTEFRRMLKKYGIDLDRDCRKMNAINCRAIDSKGRNRPPTPKEIKACQPRVWKEIERFKPKAIILLGGAALHSFLSGRWHEEPGKISKWRGWSIPDRDVGCWVFPMFHPSYVVRSRERDEKNNRPAQQVVETVFLQDLDNALKTMGGNLCPTFEDERKRVEILRTPKQIKSVLKDFRPDFAAFDYETTGLKPYNSGHRLVSLSVSDGSKVYSFPVLEKAQKFIQSWIQDPKIRKSAHSAKFEDTWTTIRLGCDVGGWSWDSQLAAHALDNRPGITGLKFQTYIQYGMIDYASHMTPYLRANNANGINRIMKAPFDDILIYG